MRPENFLWFLILKDDYLPIRCPSHQVTIESVLDLNIGFRQFLITLYISVSEGY